MEEVLLALGSNLGDRLRHLRAGVRSLGSVLEVTHASSVFEGPAREVDAGPPQGAYLNAVVRGRTGLAPEALLEACLDAEARRGRERSYEKAPRTLDVDILFYGDRVIRRRGLRVPHPRWKQRDFVVVPLLEVAPDWIDPETSRRVAAVAEELELEMEPEPDAGGALRRFAGPGALIDPTEERT